PRQSLCTLRNHRRQWPRNTRYQAGRYPLTWAGLSLAGSHQLCLAHSLDHLVGGYEEGIGQREVECLDGFEVDDKSVHRWLHGRRRKRIGETLRFYPDRRRPILR